MSRVKLTHVLTAIALAVIAIGASTRLVQARRQATVPAANVSIDNFKFEPSTLEVTAGTKVTWTNGDDEPHVIVSVAKSLFASRPLDTGDTFSQVFKETGTYEYYCSLHPHMTAKIVVK